MQLFSENPVAAADRQRDGTWVTSPSEIRKLDEQVLKENVSHLVRFFPDHYQKLTHFLKADFLFPYLAGPHVYGFHVQTNANRRDHAVCGSHAVPVCHRFLTHAAEQSDTAFAPY